MTGYINKSFKVLDAEMGIDNRSYIASVLADMGAMKACAFFFDEKGEMGDTLFIEYILACFDVQEEDTHKIAEAIRMDDFMFLLRKHIIEEIDEASDEYETNAEKISFLIHHISRYINKAKNKSDLFKELFDINYYAFKSYLTDVSIAVSDEKARKAIVEANRNDDNPEYDGKRIGLYFADLYDRMTDSWDPGSSIQDYRAKILSNYDKMFTDIISKLILVFTIKRRINADDIIERYLL